MVNRMSMVGMWYFVRSLPNRSDQGICSTRLVKDSQIRLVGGYGRLIGAGESAVRRPPRQGILPSGGLRVPGGTSFCVKLTCCGPYTKYRFAVPQ